MTTFKGSPATTAGAFVKVGEKAPDFTLVGTDLSEKSLKDFGGIVVLNIFPSLDTGVCAMSVRKFNTLAASLSSVTVLAISKDLPFAHSRFCTVEGIENVQPLSAFRCEAFGKDYGVLLTDTPLQGLFARAIVVIKDGTVIYTEMVPEVTTEPNYDAAIAAIKSA